MCHNWVCHHRAGSTCRCAIGRGQVEGLGCRLVLGSFVRHLLSERVLNDVFVLIRAATATLFSLSPVTIETISQSGIHVLEGLAAGLAGKCVLRLSFNAGSVAFSAWSFAIFNGGCFLRHRLWFSWLRLASLAGLFP